MDDMNGFNPNPNYGGSMGAGFGSGVRDYNQQAQAPVVGGLNGMNMGGLSFNPQAGMDQKTVQAKIKALYNDGGGGGVNNMSSFVRPPAALPMGVGAALPAVGNKAYFSGGKVPTLSGGGDGAYSINHGGGTATLGDNWNFSHLR